MQPDVFQAACLCRLKAVFKAALKEEWYVCGYVTIFLARPGALFKECYSIQNTFPVLSSVSCSQSLSQSVPESLAGQCLVSQGLMFSWQEGRSAAAGESQSENRYSCCGCVCLLPALLCACHWRCRADTGSKSHQALGPCGAGLWPPLLCLLAVQSA